LIVLKKKKKKFKGIKIYMILNNFSSSGPLNGKGGNIPSKGNYKYSKEEEDDDDENDDGDNQDLPLNKNSASNPIDESGDPGELRECPEGCGRSFNLKALKSHVKVCKKVFQSKRKVFDSAQARALEEEAASYQKPKNSRNNKGGYSMNVGVNDKAAKKSKWKQQSEAFRAVIKGARGGEISKEDQNAIDEARDSGLVLCNFCGRKFSDQAAKKHIPFCESKSKTQSLRSKIGLKKR
jgi:hypothetical protein